VSEMPPNGEPLPANTYLLRRGYDKRRKAIVKLSADGSLDLSKFCYEPIRPRQAVQARPLVAVVSELVGE